MVMETRGEKSGASTCTSADTKNSAPQSHPISAPSAPQPIFRTPISAPSASEPNTNMNTHLLLWILIIGGVSLLYYRIRKWRNQPEANIEYEAVEFSSTPTSENQQSDNPKIS